jgi:hypothetical protein
MRWDGAFVSTGATGKAQAVTDRSDPSTIPEKASREVLVMIFLSPCMAAAIGCIQFTCLSSKVSPGRSRRRSEPSATSAHAEEGTSALRICVRRRRTRSTLTPGFRRLWPSHCGEMQMQSPKAQPGKEGRKGAGIRLLRQAAHGGLSAQAQGLPAGATECCRECLRLCCANGRCRSLRHRRP